MAEIWAKSNGTRLSKHIKYMLKALNILKDKKIIPNEFEEPIKLSIIYHDMGKVLPSFQIKTLGNKKYTPFDLIYEIPHSLFSIFWINFDMIKKRIGDEKLAEFVFSSVAYHHWREEFDKYITGRKDLSPFCEWILKTKDELLSNLKEELKLLSNDKDLDQFINDLNLDEKRVYELKKGAKFYDYAVPPYKFDYEPLRMVIKNSIEDNKKWILISGFLQRCDHFASWCEEENEDLDKIEIPCENYGNVKNKIKEKIKIDDENKIWQIAKIENNNNKNKDLILIAPTGYGKTEFAFLWSADKKFIYTLPLRSAVNQIYERAEKIFGSDKTGILHSDTDVYLLEKKGDVGDNIKLYELSKNLSFPVIISTGDQFFPYGIRPPGYEKVFSLFSYSRLVVDEVQAYNPKACAIIIKFIQWVKTMGGNFLLMTATMPEFVKNTLKDLKISYNEINIYEDEKDRFKKIIKHKIKVEFIKNKKDDLNIPDEILDKVIEEAQNAKRVLFVLNTVKQAQNVYERLKKKFDNSFLIHSRFTFEDRKKKEIELIGNKFQNPKPLCEKEGKILVATQVVEASLDIDADVLFTEICPLDALVQRMGRVLRRIGPNFELENERDNKKIYKNKYNDAQKYEIDLTEPNVYVIVFKEGLESGKKSVYHKELLRLSLAWLWKKSQKNIEELEFNEKPKSQFFDEEFKTLLSPNNAQSQKKKGKKKEKSVLERIMSDEEPWIESLNNVIFQINEYEKYKIVKLFYESFSEDTRYLKEFNETLDILEKGFMSDKKEEAEKIFREIYDVNVIPWNKKDDGDKIDDFIRSVENFIHSGKENFIYFKKEILSKYVVSIPYKEQEIKSENWIYYKILEKLGKNLKEKWKMKLKNWLSGIYIANISYDPDLGVKSLSQKISKRIIE